jgi:acetoin utilization deacetylase AcuC-like enzyme
VCAAIDRVVTGHNANAFCAVRPPGHHAGPRGLVTCANDHEGSHGFCLLNNVAIGAAYARSVYGRSTASYARAVKTDAPATYGESSTAHHASEPAATNGLAVSAEPTLIRRIAIFDFDVHHGNGTEAILRNLYPSEVVNTLRLPFGNAAFSMMSYKPWLDETDGGEVLFVSSHGYGKRDPGTSHSSYRHLSCIQ